MKTGAVGVEPARRREPAARRPERERGRGGGAPAPVAGPQGALGNLALGRMLNARPAAGAPAAPVPRGDVVPSDDASERAARLAARAAVEGTPPAAREAPRRRPPPSKRAGGQALDEELRATMEARLGVDVGHVRVDTTPEAAAEARALGARAFTVGSDVAFASGTFDPATRAGQELLAHELIHATHDGDGRVRRDIDPNREAERVSTSSETGFSGTGTVVAHRWMEINGLRLVEELRTRLAAVQLHLPVAALAWHGSPALFIGILLEELGSNPSTAELVLGMFLAPDRLTDAINVGRDVAVTMTGPMGWDQGVVSEVERRLILRIHESLGRVARNVARRVAREWSEPRPPIVTPPPHVSRPSADTDQFTFAPFVLGSLGLPPPRAEDAFSRPIDGFVASALRQSVDVDARTYRAAYPAEFTPAAVAADEQPLRPVHVQFLASQGLSNWVRVTDPPDATLAEVAFALYGDAAAAHRLIGAPPLFALPEEDLPTSFGEPQITALPRATTGADFEYRPLLRFEHVLAFQDALAHRPRDRAVGSGSDPATEILESDLSDEVALRGAVRIRPTPGANDALISERLRVIASQLAEMEEPAVELSRRPGSPRVRVIIDAPAGTSTVVPYDPPEAAEMRHRVVSTRERIERRLAGLGAGSAAIWDGQTAGQIEIVNTALSGVLFAVTLAREYESWPSVFRLINDIGDAYVSAVEVSDIYELARARLDAAERRSALFPATALEMWLAQLRAALDEARTTEVAATDEGNVEQSRGVTEMDALERELRGRLALVRGQLLSDPAGAREELTAILARVNELQTGVSIAMNLDTVDRVWQALYDNLTFWGAARSLWGGGNAEIERAMDANLRLNTEWHTVLALWRSGDREAARLMLRQKAEGPWRHYIADITAQIQDHQMWDSVMNFAAMVGIAVLSGGIGAYVETAAGAYWGVTAASSLAARAGVAAVGAAVETTTFSLLSYPMQPGDVGFGEYFMTNLAFVGGARVIGSGFEAAVGQRFAQTFEGRLLNSAVQTTAMIGANVGMAEVQSMRDRDRQLSGNEIATISLQNIAFVGATSLAGALLRTPLRNLRLQGHLDGLQARHSNNLATLERTMNALPPGRPPPDLRNQLFDDVQRALVSEQELSAQLRSIVERADAMSDVRARERELRRWNIDEDMAARFRDGATPSEVLANVRMMQGLRVTRALEAVGRDFAVSSAMYDEAFAYFTSVPGTTVEAGDAAFVLPSTLPAEAVDPGYVIFVQPDSRAVPVQTGARSFVVRSGQEPAFRVYERARAASGELAPHVDMAARPEDVAAERGATTEGRLTTGGRASADPVLWGMPSPAIEALRQQVLRGGVGAVQGTAQRAGLHVDRAALDRVLRYMFDSQGIAFLPENHQWWQRLASGRATVHDLRILVHELEENVRFEEIRRETGFDYMGAGFVDMSSTEQRQWQADFNRHYEQDAHVRALEEEYTFLAQEIARQTNGRVRLGRNIVAAIDPLRAEGRDLIREGGYPLIDNINFERWSARGAEVVDVGSTVQRRLGLLDPNATLAEIVAAVQRRRLDPGGSAGRPFEAPGAPLTVDSERRSGWRPERQRGRGGATWDPNAHPNPSAHDVLTLPFADGTAIGRELFWRGRDLLVRSTSLTASQKADTFEELARRINQIDPSWMARRGPAANAAGFFTGDARPFGFAIDADGNLWQTLNFIDSVDFTTPAGPTIDYSKWQRVTP